MLSELVQLVISDSSSYASGVLMLFVLQRVAESALVGVEVHHEVHGCDFVFAFVLVCEPLAVCRIVGLVDDVLFVCFNNTVYLI